MFPPMVVQMIGVGEATGALDTMLAKIADFYEEEVDVAVAGLLTLLEPMMIALLGGVVGGIVIAMYMPIFGLISKLTGGRVSSLELDVRVASVGAHRRPRRRRHAAARLGDPRSSSAGRARSRSTRSSS